MAIADVSPSPSATSSRSPATRDRHRGRPGLAADVASRHGVRGVTEQMALEVAPQGIRVPDDIARGVLFCASDLSIFMAGSTLLADAGGTI